MKKLDLIISLYAVFLTHTSLPMKHHANMLEKGASQLLQDMEQWINNSLDQQNSTQKDCSENFISETEEETESQDIYSEENAISHIEDKAPFIPENFSTVYYQGPAWEYLTLLKPAATQTTINTHKKFLCPDCNRSFTQKYYLAVHMQIHDPNRQRPFHCHLCNKSFFKQANLNYHIPSHNKKKYFCSFCDYSSTRASVIKIHERGHTGEKPYICKECHTSFAMKGTLNEHMRIHTGEEPFICQFCYESFRYRSYLKKHIAQCHQDKK